MELTLRRRDANALRTIGQLFVDGLAECYTLEDAERIGPKVAGRTAIPAGRYRVTITESQRFKRPLPLVHEVPGFSGIRIHPGNTAADTEGCILVGAERGTDEVLQSRVAMDGLQPKIQRALDNNEDVWLTIS